MTSKLSQYMSEYSGIAIKHKRSPEYTTKHQRRAAIKSIVQQLKSIMAAEVQCLENIPENFKESSNFESADNTNTKNILLDILRFNILVLRMSLRNIESSH
jgi:hypothetical protein